MRKHFRNKFSCFKLSIYFLCISSTRVFFSRRLKYFFYFFLSCRWPKCQSWTRQKLSSRKINLFVTRIFIVTILKRFPKKSLLNAFFIMIFLTYRFIAYHTSVPFFFKSFFSYCSEDLGGKTEKVGGKREKVTWKRGKRP